MVDVLAGCIIHMVVSVSGKVPQCHPVEVDDPELSQDEY